MKKLVERVRASKSLNYIDSLVNAAVKRRGKLNRGLERVVKEHKRELALKAREQLIKEIRTLTPIR